MDLLTFLTFYITVITAAINVLIVV